MSPSRLNMLYSIIIPHHDTPALLMRCLDSIPVREDVQVIVVDDCSPGAEHYLEQYPQLHRPYLEFYSTAEGGSAGRARNVGLQHARGRWLLFADADDFFADNLDELLDAYKDDDAELIYFRTRSVCSDDVNRPARRSEWLDDLWHDYEHGLDPQSLYGRCPVVWGKMFRRELIEHHTIRFDETRYSNDFWFSANAALRARSFRVVTDVLYVATLRPGSLAHDMNGKPGELAERAEVCFRVERLLLEHGIYTHPYEPIIPYLRLLFDQGQHTLYYHYLRQLRQLGFPTLLALRQMCHHATRGYKVRVYLLSYLHLYF